MNQSIILIAIFASQLSAAIIVDDFNSSSINSARWNVAIVPNGVGTVAQTNQQLKMAMTANQGYLGLQGKFFLAGDFDVRVDFSLVNWPAASSSTVRLAAMDLPEGPLGMSGVYRNSYSDENYQFRGLDGVISSGAVNDVGGKLRVTRSNLTLTGYYWNGSGWVAIGSMPTTGVDTRFLMDFSSQGAPVANLVVTFDNFVAVDSIPEPSTFALFVVGLASIPLLRKK